MAYFDLKELIADAKEAFIEGNYRRAEPLLQQALLKSQRDPEIYHMLATLYYDKGKFNKAIQTFKRAIELDPTYTDASIGLSIILNDLGRYEEGKTVFKKAQEALNQKKTTQKDPFIEEKIAQKHIELSDLYSQIQQYETALDQLQMAKPFTEKIEDLTIRMANCLFSSRKPSRAIRELEILLRRYPKNVGARNLLGHMLYQMNRVYEATEHWEKTLMFDPSNVEAKNYLKMAKETGLTELVPEL